MIARIGLGIAGFALMLCIVSVIWFKDQVDSHLLIENGTLFEVKKGDTATHVLMNIQKISENSLNPYAGKIWLRLYLGDQPIQKGVYELSSDMNLEQVFALFQSGKQKQFSITLVEGLTFVEWLAVMKATPYLIDDWTEETSSALLNTLHKPLEQSVNSWEGLLLAETYAYTANSSISELVTRAAEQLYSELRDIKTSFPLPEALNTVYEALILASIVEKETAQAEERPLIAGVFLNRLTLNMRLQTDPTVIYGIGDDFDGDITRAHLRQPTPYNTYVIKGLPPTPIAMVGREALRAIYQPMPTEYLYFVSKGDGTHQFTETLNEHNRAVRKYQLGLDE